MRGANAVQAIDGVGAVEATVDVGVTVCAAVDATWCSATIAAAAVNAVGIHDARRQAGKAFDPSAADGARVNRTGESPQ